MEYVSLIPVAHAQTVDGIVNSIVSLLQSIIPILFILATLVFFWGIILFITSGGDEEKRTEGRKYIIFGLIGLFVMVAVWGIVNLALSFFNFDLSTPTVPKIPGATESGGNGGGCFGFFGQSGCE